MTQELEKDHFGFLGAQMPSILVELGYVSHPSRK